MTAVDSETTQIGSWLPATGHPRWRVAVVNGANETVGTTDDLIVTPNEKVLYAVVSIGGFLGMDSKYVVVLCSLLVMHDKQMLLPGATKESLKSLPEFNYSS